MSIIDRAIWNNGKKFQINLKSSRVDRENFLFTRKSTFFVIVNFFFFFSEKAGYVKNGIIFFRVDHKPLITRNVVHTSPYFSFHSKILVVRRFEFNDKRKEPRYSMEYLMQKVFEINANTHTVSILSFLFFFPLEKFSPRHISHFTIDFHFRSG